MNKNILVTGTRRSGTTFLGRMLSVKKEISYIHEPFNRNQGVKSHVIDRWYISPENLDMVEFDKIVDKLINRKKVETRVSFGDVHGNDLKFDVSFSCRIMNLIKNYSSESLIKRFGKIFFKNRFYLTYLKTRLNYFYERLLIKDPFLALMSEHLLKKFDFKIIFIIRHPAAFYNSMKKREWYIKKNNFMKSEQIVEKHFKNVNLLEGFKKNEEKIIMEYVIVNKILTDIAKKNNIYVVRLEDIGTDPLKEFKQIYEYLDIPFTKRVRRKVIAHTKNNNTNSGSLSDIKRDSAATIDRWKKELSLEEKDFIKRRTYQYFKEKYPAETWK